MLFPWREIRQGENMQIRGETQTYKNCFYHAFCGVSHEHVTSNLMIFAAFLIPPTLRTSHKSQTSNCIRGLRKPLKCKFFHFCVGKFSFIKARWKCRKVIKKKFFFISTSGSLIKLFNNKVYYVSLLNLWTHHSTNKSLFSIKEFIKLRKKHKIHDETFRCKIAYLNGN